MAETFEKANVLRDDAERLLRELELELRRLFLNFKDPAGATQTFEPKFRRLYQGMDKIVRDDPASRQYMSSLRSATESQRQSMVQSAQKAHRDRGQLEPGLASRYNGQVGAAMTSLSKLPDRAVEQTLRQMVGSILPQNDVPGDVRAKLAGTLADWIKNQEQTQTQDAFFVAQNVLMSVAEYLHHKLTIQGQIVSTRDQLKGRREITTQQACEADQCVGELAKRSVELDAELRRAIDQSVLKVKANFRLDPKLVLDPTKAFLGGVQARAGIKLEQHGVTVDLGTSLTVIDPTGDAGLDVNAHMNVRSGNASFGLNAGSSYRGGKHTGSQIKAQLSWTF